MLLLMLIPSIADDILNHRSQEKRIRSAFSVRASEFLGFLNLCILSNSDYEEIYPVFFRGLNQNLGEDDTKDIRDAQLPRIKLRTLRLAFSMFFEVWFIADPYFCPKRAARNPRMNRVIEDKSD